MVDRDKVFEVLVIIGGCLGNIMIWAAMAAGCILLWYFVFAFILS